MTRNPLRDSLDHSERTKTCACGASMDRHATQCRACWKTAGPSLGNNSFRVRPDLLVKANARRRECPTCGWAMKPGNYRKHVALHDPWGYVDASGDCWEWTGAVSNGYGVYRPQGSRGGGVVAHRWVWMQLVGTIPAGMQLDHLCRNTRCVNPDHLEIVTPVENRRRGMSPAARASRLNRCYAGHERTPENTRTYRTGRQCIPCRRAYDARRWAERSAGAA